MDGHGTEPYEQNTQQWPAVGRSMAWQFAHWWKNAQASSGITSDSACPHAGQRSVEWTVAVMDRR